MGGIGILLCLLARSLQEKVDYYVPVDEIKRTEIHLREGVTHGAQCLKPLLTHEQTGTVHKPAEYSHGGDVSILGFWFFLATDLLVFACLFATFVILRTHTDGGPTGSSIFDVNGFVAETFILLTSSFTCGLATFAMRKGNRKAALRLG